MAFVSAGWRIEKIIVTGVADGTPHPGSKCDTSLVPVACRQNLDFENIKDPELAFLRGCLIWEYLPSLLKIDEVGYVGGMEWHKATHDELDTGPRGHGIEKLALKFFPNQEKQ